MDELKPVENSRTQQFILMSSMYAQLLVVICITFFTSEVVTPLVPLFYFEGFYFFLYGVSLLFLLYINIYILREIPHNISTSDDGEQKPSIMENLRRFGDRGQKFEPGDTPVPPRLKKSKISENDRSHGNLFLRIGAVAFGLGTMVYNGLEFGQFFEIPYTSPCYTILLGIKPILQMLFTFAQMYFIFVNARLNIHKFKVIARFGLMHLIATNLCVWIRMLGKETLHEITRHLLKKGHHGLLEEFMMPFRGELRLVHATSGTSILFLFHIFSLRRRFYGKARHGQVVKALDSQSEGHGFESSSQQSCSPFQPWGSYKLQSILLFVGKRVAQEFLMGGDD
ncbi:proton channel OtopLc-like isoform X2 [Tachypleus tridentatus]|uniref:proton channel OtopLc-like isoform X2 n=1 Tax=Tachypleus tridentatus TaxID=6853 RepID=UPI003FD485BB